MSALTIRSPGGPAAAGPGRRRGARRAGSVFLARKHAGATPGARRASSGTLSPGWPSLCPACPAPPSRRRGPAWLGLLAAVTAVAAFLWSPRLLALAGCPRVHRDTQPRTEAAAARHRSALARWQRYELDPGCCIDFPDMTDVRPAGNGGPDQGHEGRRALRGRPKPGLRPRRRPAGTCPGRAERAAGVAGVDRPRRSPLCRRAFERRSSRRRLTSPSSAAATWPRAIGTRGRSPPAVRPDPGPHAGECRQARC